MSVTYRISKSQSTQYAVVKNGASSSILSASELRQLCQTLGQTLGPALCRCHGPAWKQRSRGAHGPKWKRKSGTDGTFPLLESSWEKTPRLSPCFPVFPSPCFPPLPISGFLSIPPVRRRTHQARDWLETSG